MIQLAWMALMLGTLSLFACGESSRSVVEPLELPHWRECAESYGGDVDARFEARDRGEEFAILCALAIDEGRNLPRADFESVLHKRVQLWAAVVGGG